MPNPIILFDGVCNLCNNAVQFIIRHDKNNIFKFASLQSATGKKLLAHYNLPADSLDSFVLIDNGKAFTKSTGALHVTKKLNGIWPGLYSFIVIPKIFRDSIYDLFGKNRYKWFGKKDACMIPTADLKARFLD